MLCVQYCSYSVTCTVLSVQCFLCTVVQSYILNILFQFSEIQVVFLSIISGKLSGVNTTTQEFDSQNLNDENIRVYLQNHLDTHVGTFSLWGNQLTDLLWVSEFSELDTLKVLDVSSNRIESFSWDDIPPLTEEIGLWENNLVSLPHIGKHNACVHVKTLDLDNNQLENMQCSHIPHTVVELYLSHNKIKTLCDMTLFTQLRTLYLHDNQLTTVSADHLPPSLQTIYLRNNLFDCVNIKQSLSVSVDCDW